MTNMNLSRREINELWMQSRDIYEFAFRIQQAANNQNLSAVRELVVDIAENVKRETLPGLQPRN